MLQVISFVYVFWVSRFADMFRVSSFSHVFRFGYRSFSASPPPPPRSHFLGLLFGGGTGGWVGVPIYYLFRELKLTATRMQQLRAVASTPWSIKPLIGVLDGWMRR
jgi:hypothetical protein